MDPTKPTTTTQSSASPGGSSGNTAVIAVAVTIPLAILIAIIVVVYILYRRKYPVRMIIGREFAKFRNPNYDRPRSGATLVRDDADSYFSSRPASMGGPGEHSEDYNPINPGLGLTLAQDNRGFQPDDDEENKQERAFMLKKSWLFKNKGDGEVQMVDETDGKEVVKGAGPGKPDRGSVSEDSDVEELLANQKATPIPKRKQTGASTSDGESMGSSVDDTTSYSKDDKSNTSVGIVVTPVKESRSEVKLAKSLPLLNVPSIEEGKSARSQSLSLESNFLGKSARSNSLLLAPYPEVKPTRSMSLSVAPCLEIHLPESSVDGKSIRSKSTDECARPRSVSIIDPSKSARKTSRGAEVLFTSTRQFLSASVVEAIVRNQGSAYSSETSLTCSMREHAKSFSSVNSNPHLVTDLDDSVEEERMTDGSDDVLEERMEISEAKNVLNSEPNTCVPDADPGLTFVADSARESDVIGSRVDGVMNDCVVEQERIDGCIDTVDSRLVSSGDDNGTNQPMVSMESGSDSFLILSHPPPEDMIESEYENFVFLKNDESEQEESVYENFSSARTQSSDLTEPVYQNLASVACQSESRKLDSTETANNKISLEAEIDGAIVVVASAQPLADPINTRDALQDKGKNLSNNGMTKSLESVHSDEEPLDTRETIHTDLGSNTTDVSSGNAIQDNPSLSYVDHGEAPADIVVVPSYSTEATSKDKESAGKEVDSSEDSDEGWTSSGSSSGGQCQGYSFGNQDSEEFVNLEGSQLPSSSFATNDDDDNDETNDDSLVIIPGLSGDASFASSTQLEHSAQLQGETSDDFTSAPRGHSFVETNSQNQPLSSSTMVPGPTKESKDDAGSDGEESHSNTDSELSSLKEDDVISMSDTDDSSVNEDDQSKAPSRGQTTSGTQLLGPRSVGDDHVEEDPESPTDEGQFCEMRHASRVGDEDDDDVMGSLSSSAGSGLKIVPTLRFSDGSSDASDESYDGLRPKAVMADGSDVTRNNLHLHRYSTESVESQRSSYGDEFTFDDIDAVLDPRDLPLGFQAGNDMESSTGGGIQFPGNDDDDVDFSFSGSKMYRIREESEEEDIDV